MPTIAPIPRTERRLMQKTIHKTRDKNHARRLTAMLMLHRGSRVTDVARTLCCARSSVGRWINWFTLYCAEGLISLRPGRERRWSFEQICALLVQVVCRSAGDFGYQRSRWSTELLAIKINEITGCKLHPGTVRRWLPSAGLVWRRAAPLCIYAIRTRMKKWRPSTRLWINAALSIRCFTKMRWIFTSIPKSVRTGRFVGSKNAWLHPDR